MKKSICLFVGVLFSLFSVFANDAYTKVSGGSILPLSKTKNENIKMEKEEINFTLYKDHYDINVKFYFKNYGPTETIEVGFPQWKHRQPTEDDFYYFKSKVNNVTTNFTVKELEKPEPLNKSMVITKWYIRSVTFESNEITTTEVEYSAPYGVYGISESADYLFGTGATWKDCIGEMIIKITNTTDDVWINAIRIDNSDLGNIIRENNTIVIQEKNVYPKIESEIFLELDRVPDCLVSLRVINPERRWNFRDYIISESKLKFYSTTQLRYLRNLMFAAYGHTFKSDDINQWLKKYCSDWYTPKGTVTEKQFNENEKKNLALIQQEEARRNNPPINYLNEYFGNEKYSTISSKMENIYLSYIERDNTKLVTKGLIYNKIDNVIQPLFFIDGYIIKDKDSNQVSYPIATQEFFGWKIELDKTSISFQIFTNQGKNTTDPIIFYWNDKEKKYEKFRINPLDL